MKMWFLLVVVLCSFAGSSADCLSPLGMSSRSIKDHQITASSTFSEFTKPEAARLRNQRVSGQMSFGGWCAEDSDTQPYLQIDLQKESVVLELATQGLEYPSGNWVTEYAVNYSCDGVSWTEYQDKRQRNPKVFKGNTDDATVVKIALSLPIIARLIRFRPLKKRPHGSACMRVEMYGCDSKRDELYKDCSVAVGMENGRISAPQITSSSYFQNHFPFHGRLNNKDTVVNGNVSWGAWCSNDVMSPQYLQVDLGSKRTISGVATQGYGSLGWVTKFKIKYSLDERDWKTFKENKTKTDKVFDGNWDAETIITQYADRRVEARYVRFVPIAWKTPGSICMRVEVYQCIYYKGCPRLATTLKPTGTQAPNTSTDTHVTLEPSLTIASNKEVNGINSSSRIIRVDYLALFVCCLCRLFLR